MLFDSSFVFSDLRWICTKKLAYKCWPDAPAHRNQVLRYWRKLDEQFDDRARGVLDIYAPHRAIADAMVTAYLLTDLMDELDWDVDLALEISSQPVLLPTVGFGKHFGLKWSEVPKDYLRWLLTQDFDEDVKHTANYHLQ